MTETRKINDNNQQQQKNTERYNYQDNYYNNNYIYSGAGRVQRETPRLKQEELDQIRECYNDNIGAMTGASAKLIENAIKAGLTFSEVIMAIEETGLAPNPSGFYLKKILETWCETGVTVSRIRHECKRNEGVKWWNGR